MRLAIVLGLILTGCMPPDKPAEPDAGPPVAVDDGWCIDTPPPQPVPGTGQEAPEYPEEFAICLHEEERWLLVLYITSLRDWSEDLYAARRCD